MKRDPLELAEVSANNISKVIENMLPKGWGYIIAFQSGVTKKSDRGIATCLSNMNRKNQIIALREMADKLESREVYT